MTISHVRVPLLIALAFSLLLGFGPHPVRAVDESPSPEPMMLTTVLVAEPPIESGEEAIAAILATGAPFAEFALADRAMIGASATYTVAGDSEVGWKVTFSYGWGDCRAGCISAHTFTYKVDTMTGEACYTSDAGDPLPSDVPAAIANFVPTLVCDYPEGPVDEEPTVTETPEKGGATPDASFWT